MARSGHISAQDPQSVHNSGLIFGLVSSAKIAATEHISRHFPQLSHRSFIL